MYRKVFVFLMIIFATSCFSQYNYKLWSTYYFGIDSKTSAAILDLEGNIVVAGTTLFRQPVEYYETFTTPGCHKGYVSGENGNGFICKFSADGGLLWATYYGSDYTRISDLAIDSANNLYVVGGTQATSGIATPGAFIEQSVASSAKGFLTKFDAEGQLIWGTYFPAPISSMCITANDEIFVCGDNDLDMPDNLIGTPGSWQPEWTAYFDAGTGTTHYINGFINKFNTEGTRLAGTFTGNLYGGYNRITSDSDGNVYVSHVITANYAPPGLFASAGCHQSSLGGAEDIVISKFSSSLDQRIWSSYYGGSSDDRCSGLMVRNGMLFVVGNTLSVNNISSVGSFQPEMDGLSDGFLAAFDLNGQRNWSTYFGGEALDFILALNVTDSHIFIGGHTSSSQSIAVEDAYQQTIIGGEGYFGDGFLEVFTHSGQREWGTYFGGDGLDYVKEVLVSNEDIFIAGETNSTTGISTPGSVQPDFSNGSHTGPEPYTNMYLAKLSSNPLGITTVENSPLQLSPNPNHGVFELRGLSAMEEFALSIYDNLGREVIYQKRKAVGDSASFDFTDELAIGSYFFKVSTRNRSTVLRLFIY